MQHNSQVNGARKDKEAVIFTAACRVIRAKGYHQARITDIAQEAGISYGLVYHYFKSKSDLFDAILEEWWTGLFGMMDEWENNDLTIKDKLSATVKFLLDEYEKRPDLVHIFVTEISRSSANLTPTRLKWIKLFMSRIEQTIADAQADKTLRQDVKARYLTHIFLGAVEGFISAMVLENQPLKGRAQKKRITVGLMEVFLNGARRTES